MTIRPKILVTGATGKTGNAVARQLLSDGWPVRALVHREDARSAELVRLGAEVAVANMFDFDQLVDALRGAQYAYYLTLFQPYMLQAATAFAAAARQTRLHGVVQMSQWTSHRAHPAFLTRETWLVDQLFSMLPDTAHVILNPGMFADNYLRLIDFASLLRFYPILTGDGRSAPVSNEDIARVAVALLKDPQRYAGQRFRPTGPKLLDGAEMAAAIAKVLGHGVLPVRMPRWMFLKAARVTGADLYEVSNYLHYTRDHVAGTFSFGGGVTQVVQEMTGSPAEDFEAIARRYAAMPFAAPTAANRLKAFARFNLIPFVPGYDPAALERRMAFPKPARTSLSAEDERWRTEHAAQMSLSKPPPDGLPRDRPASPLATHPAPQA